MMRVFWGFVAGAVGGGVLGVAMIALTLAVIVGVRWDLSLITSADPWLLARFCGFMALIFGVWGALAEYANAR